MFTGIVQALGTVQSISRRPTGVRLIVSAPDLARPIVDGASIAVNGTCLTVTASDDTCIEFDAVPETLSQTTLGSLSVGARVNLEPSLRAGDHMDGHIVQGHVDAIARIERIRSGEQGQLYSFKIDADALTYIIPKGSVTIDGISLTIAAIDENAGTFSVALIPTTLASTTLGEARVGDRVNIETDVLARTVVTTMQRYLRRSGGRASDGGELTMDMLRENGW